MRASTIVSIRSSVTTRSAASRAALRAVSPECDPDVSQPHRRGVVGTVTSHRDRTSQALQRMHDPHLVHRRDASEDRDVGNDRVQRCVRHLIELVPGDDPPTVEEPELCGDARRRARVIAGDHDHVDARGAKVGDRAGRCGPRRVGQGDETQELEPIDMAIVEGDRFTRRTLTDSEHTKAAAGERLDPRGERLAIVVGERHGIGPVSPRRAPPEDDLGCTLDVHHRGRAGVADRRVRIAAPARRGADGAATTSSTRTPRRSRPSRRPAHTPDRSGARERHRAADRRGTQRRAHGAATRRSRRSLHRGHRPRSVATGSRRS